MAKTNGSAVRVLKTAKGMEVKTNLTDQEALAVLRDVPGSFAADLLTKDGRWGLSPDQIAWAHKLAIESLARKAGLVKVRTYANIPMRLRAMLATDEYPKLSVGKGASKVEVSLAGARSKYAGDVMITDGRRYPNNLFHGRLDGSTGEHVGNCPDFVFEALESLDGLCGAPMKAAEPVKATRARKPKLETAQQLADRERDEAIRPGTEPEAPVPARRSRKSTKPAAVKLVMSEDELEAADEARWAAMNGSSYRDRHEAN